MHDLLQKVESFAPVRVALVGDFMLDCYVYGDAERISPEAPVPVLTVVRQESRPGGAGNVAASVAALGAGVRCVGVCGQDAQGAEMLDLLKKPTELHGSVDVQGILPLSSRPTTIKTRFVGLAQHRHAQQMIRIDNELSQLLTAQERCQVAELARGALAGCAVLAIEDYNKGVCSAELLAEVIGEARKKNMPVLVDPARITDYSRYRGCTLLTPNRYEAQLASGVKITDAASLSKAARAIIAAAGAQAVVIKLDREGAFVCTRDGQEIRVPTRPRSVYDVTGAGDEVLATLAVALANGLELADATALANVAGGLEVERFGVVPVTRQELLEELRGMLGLRSGKVLGRARLAEEIARRKKRGETVAFTNGCFDLLHVGHVRYLQQAREMGSCLVVAINSDASVQKLKGPTRPVIKEHERAEMLAALECVDFVTIFDEDTPIPLLEALRPDVLVKGGTTPYIVGKELVESYGGKVMNMALVEGMSTTSIINRIVGNPGA